MTVYARGTMTFNAARQWLADERPDFAGHPAGIGVALSLTTQRACAALGLDADSDEPETLFLATLVRAVVAEAAAGVPLPDMAA